MRSLFVVILFSVGCTQSQFPGASAPEKAQTASPNSDSGIAVQPVDMVHRLKAGMYRTGDGALLPANFTYDTALNMQCFPAVGDDDLTRCFPNIGYVNRSFKDPGCTHELVVGDPGIQLSGTYRGNRFRITRVGVALTDTFFYTLSDSDACLAKLLVQGKVVYEAGEDISDTLETMDLVFP